MLGWSSGYRSERSNSLCTVMRIHYCSRSHLFVGSPYMPKVAILHPVCCQAWVVFASQKRALDF